MKSSSVSSEVKALKEKKNTVVAFGRKGPGLQFDQGGPGGKKRKVDLVTNQDSESLVAGLQEWSKAEFGNISDAIKSKQAYLERLMRRPDCRDACIVIPVVEREINELLKIEEKLWSQRAKTMWQLEGDKNTAFFHACASQRKKANWIKGIFDDNHEWIADNNAICNYARKYFQDVFKGEGSLRSDVEKEPGRSWNGNLIKECFSDTQAKAVLAVPICVGPVTDQFIWSGTNRGVYSVKTGYYFARNILYSSVVAAEHDQSYHIIDDFPWEKIWKLNILPKIKDFIWRACKGIIPICHNLQLRGVALENACPICGEFENIEHALMTCSKAVECWHSISFNIPNTSFMDFISNILQGNTHLAEKICVLAWGIWNNRNARDLTKNGRQDRGEQLIPHWVRPPSDLVKCNFDASINKQAFKSSYGGVVRCSDATVMLCYSGFFDGCYPPVIAETLAFRESLLLFCSRGITSILMESDCLELVQVFHASLSGISELGMLVEECRHLSKKFQTFSLVWINRRVNEVAHHLAKGALSFSNRNVWDSSPAFIVPFICNDVTNSVVVATNSVSIA
ncbi:hypothetical protein ACFE04_000302 [Oxalis oulophora]